MAGAQVTRPDARNTGIRRGNREREGRGCVGPGGRALESGDRGPASLIERQFSLVRPRDQRLDARVGQRRAPGRQAISERSPSRRTTCASEIASGVSWQPWRSATDLTEASRLAAATSRRVGESKSNQGNPKRV